MPRATDTGRLGSTGLRITRLGLGTAPLGGLYEPVSDEAAEATITKAWDLGLRFFDTAPQYGNGLAERRLGAFLAGQPRDSYVLCTKVGRLLRRPAQAVGEDAYYKGTPPERPVFDFSYDGVMRSFEESLERLGTGRIDVLHIHDPDDHYDEAVAGAYRALDRLRSDGLIGAIGAGMNQSEMLASFARAGRFDCFLLAGRYTLLEQGALADFLPLCERQGIGVIIGGVYNSGVLANPAPGAKFNYADADPALIARARDLDAACARHGVPLKAAAIQFPAAHPAVATILTGARNAAEIAENEALFRHPIPAALWEDLRAGGLIDPAAPTP
ncbi:aldo/keto reductase [Ancylobacter dichloromethanicus]|uniref:Oxidoreductase n=1 Tax=Ancylobacter dichloromethanicus TaxID=518825 RepID=A0A9W6J8F7_9HYPH|nr:aldo/keto reductase [Ancylobacter dichloromethanicus]MBS7555053.1 aldo/keto reductase [Ancylobacter dichloromethanicus]GLK72262.1 oxidoreductase [Ancylobacter dichloromethanicus]